MDNLIQRYVFDVTRRIPKKQRDEVEQELKANIYDMLSDQPTKYEVEQVLLQLGKPSLLAAKYQDPNNYLISPAVFSDYLMVLTKLIALFVVLGVVGNTIDVIVNTTQSTDISALISNIIGGGITAAFDAAFQTFAWVTLGFFIYERANKKKNKEQWSIKDLPPLQDMKKRFTKLEATLDLSFSVVFFGIFIIIVYKYDVLYNFLDKDTLLTFMPFFISAWALSIINTLVKISIGVWRTPVFLLHSITNIYSAIVTILYFKTNDLINQTIVNEIVKNTEFTRTQVLDGIQTGINWIVGINILIVLLSVGISLYHTLRKNPIKNL